MRAGMGRMRLMSDVQAEHYDNLGPIVPQATAVVYSSEIVLEIFFVSMVDADDGWIEASAFFATHISAVRPAGLRYSSGYG
jgi:hypothetical protein